MSSFVRSSKYGFFRPSMAFGVMSPMNWCWNSSVTGVPTMSKSGFTPRVVMMYLRYSQWASFHMRPCSMYVSSSTIPASSGAKSAAVEVGKSLFSVSSKASEPAVPSALYVALARCTDVK